MQANQILKKDQKKENTSIFSSTLFAFKETIQIFISLCIIIEKPWKYFVNIEIHWTRYFRNNSQLLWKGPLGLQQTSLYRLFCGKDCKQRVLNINWRLQWKAKQKGHYSNGIVLCQKPKASHDKTEPHNPCVSFAWL